MGTEGFLSTFSLTTRARAERRRNHRKTFSTEQKLISFREESSEIASKRDCQLALEMCWLDLKAQNS